METVIIKASLLCLNLKDVCQSLEHDFKVRYLEDVPFDILFPSLKPAFAMNIYYLSKLVKNDSKNEFVLQNR